MVAVSGITPSGRLTLGNYLGALRRFAASDAAETGFLVRGGPARDDHAARPGAAAGAHPRDGCCCCWPRVCPPGRVFVQSTVPAHAQLAYLLECTAYVGELARMVQFKEKGRGRPTDAGVACSPTRA